MRKLLIIAAVVMGTCAGALAQDHVDVGVFADYFRLHAAPRDLFGVGARVGFRVHDHVKLEAEMAYDFERGFGEAFNNGTGALNVQPSNLRALHGLAGPKVEFGMHHLNLFATVKGGFVNFGFTNQTVAQGFTSAVNSLRNDNNGNGVFYPGGGLEGRLGPIGLRLDVGDEIYFNHGAQNNLKVTFGPFITF